jgi:hypothetical protein
VVRAEPPGPPKPGAPEAPESPLREHDQVNDSISARATIYDNEEVFEKITEKMLKYGYLAQKKRLNVLQI